MATAPPIARDRLIGLAGVSSNLVKNMEQKDRLPPRMKETKVDKELAAIGDVISRLLDHDILPWLTSEPSGFDSVIFRAATVIADRLCGAVSDPIIRNAQEQRQLALISQERAQQATGIRLNGLAGLYCYGHACPPLLFADFA